MREARETTTLARRLSQQTPKSSPPPPSLPLPPSQSQQSTASSPAIASPLHSNAITNVNSLTPPSVAASPERNFKRVSLQSLSQPPLDSTASRKKNDGDSDNFPFQRDILATATVSSYPSSPVTASTGSGSGTGTTATTAPAVLGQSSVSVPISNSLPPSLPIPTLSTIGANINSNSNSNNNNNTNSGPLHAHAPQRTHSNGGSSSIHAARTPLGSVLASNFGLASGPSTSKYSISGNGYSNSMPPIRKGSLMNDMISLESTNNSSTSASASNSVPTSNTTTATGTPTIGSSSSSSGNGGSSFQSYAPDVFINIGRTSSSLPQILIPKKRMARDIASNLSYIGAWYFFSTALSIYNKNLMGKENWNFNLPLFVSSIHAGLHFVITACLMHFWPDVFDATRSGKGGRLTIHSYVTQVVPCATAAALEICMANASLMYITLSFYTMIKSSTPIWVLIFAFTFGLEKPRLNLILIIGVIVVGVILTVAGETQFDMLGFILVLSAAVMSGLRWSLTQMLLQRDQLGMDNPVATLYYISPIMFVIMSILSLIVEDPFVVFASSEFFSDFRTGLLTIMMAAGGGFLAFAMTVAEFKLIKSTGTVTLSVAGISKEIVVISLSMLIFGDRLTFVNLLGLLVSIGGIMGYNYVKIRKMQQSHGDYEALGSVGRHHKAENND